VGSGQAVVFLPGFGCPGEVWQETVDALKDQYQCHLISYPGFNGQKALDSLWLQSISDEISQYVKTNFETAPIGVGHSLGGTLLMKVNAENNNPFSKLVLVDALPCLTAIMMPGVDPKTIVYDSPQNQQMLNMPDDKFIEMVSGMATYMSNNKEKHSTLKEWFIKADRKTWV